MSVGERQEVELKNALCKYIRLNFVLEGNPILLDQKVMDLSGGLYDLFVEFLKSYPQSLKKDLLT